MVVHNRDIFSICEEKDRYGCTGTGSITIIYLILSHEYRT